MKKLTYYFKMMYDNEIYVAAASYDQALAYAERTMECQAIIGYQVISFLPNNIFVHKI